MAINKKLIHFKNYSDFNSKKLSANETNTAYRLGVSGNVTAGEPDILYQSICWIKDVKKMWTHDTLYECNGGETLTEADIANMGFTKNQGTITEVKMNGVSKGTSGVVDLGNVPTKEQFDEQVEKINLLDYDVSDLIINKQDIITDLDAIRDGASKSATALQYYITKFDLGDLESTRHLLQEEVDKPMLIEAIRSNKLILLPIDKSIANSGYIVLNCYIDDLLYIDLMYNGIWIHVETVYGERYPDIYTEEVVIVYFHDLDAIREDASRGAKAVQPSSLASVATSGSYNDLLDKPTIPSAVTESTVSGWGFTKNTGTYSKPSGGIPKSDLATSVQESLSKAESAAQMGVTGELTVVETRALDDGAMVYATPSAANGDEDDILLSKNSVKTINGENIFGSGDIIIEGGNGTITEIQANGISVSTSGVANIPAATTSKYGVTKLTTSTNSTSTSLAATASAVKEAYDLANSFVPMTLNTSTTSFGTSLGLSPNQKYVSTIALANNVTFNIDVASIDTTKDNTWTLSFILGTSAHTINFAVTQTGYTIMWANGVAPTFEAETIYEVTFKLLGNKFLGVCGAFKTI